MKKNEWIWIWKKQATASYVGVGHTKLNDSNSNQD